VILAGLPAGGNPGALGGGHACTTGCADRFAAAVVLVVGVT